MRTTFTVLSLTASLVFLAGTPTQAQVSGLIKKKLKEAVKAPDKKEEKADQAGAEKGLQFNERLVELKGPVAAGLITGLDTEIAQLTEFKQLLTGYKTVDEYKQCEGEVAVSPEGLEVMKPFGDLPDNATREQLQAMQEKLGMAMNALIARKCGPSIDVDWPDTRRREKVDEIHRNGAAAAGLLLRSGSDGPSGLRSEESAPAPDPRNWSTAPSEPDAVWAPGVEDRPTVQAVQQAGSTEPYDLGLERYKMLCAYKKARPHMFKDLGDYNLGIEAKFYQKGLTGTVFFTNAEVRALSPMCDDGVYLKVGKVEILMEEIKITGRRR